MRNRRFAGAETALQPVGDVSEYLKSALENLKGKPKTESQDFSRQYPTIDESHAVKGTNSRIHLSARPSPLNLDVTSTIDGPVLGNRQQMQELAKNPPEVNYTMAWDVDGSYNDYGSRRDRGSKLRIAREAQRRWTEAIKKLPENALVSNSPVGAGEGDYGRADLYMANGFGPVQSDGMQYGIVRKGKVEPLSPFIADSQHVHHLAKRSRMAGDTDVSNALLAADASNQSLDQSQFTGSLGQAKGYSDYDEDYYNEDYVPPLTRADFEESARREKELDRTNPVGVPEISLRNRLSQEILNQGIDFEVQPGDIQQVRDAQLAALQQEAPMRGVADALQEVQPRSLPQRISVDNYPRDGVVPRVFTAEGLSQLPGDERRDAALRLIRDEIDSRVVGTSLARDNAGIMRDLKSSMVQNVPGAAVELYDSNDVAAVRRLQEAVAIAGGYNPTQIPRSRRRRGYGGYRPLTSAQTQLGKSGTANPPRYGEQLVNVPGASNADLVALGLRGGNPLLESRSRMLNTIQERFAPSIDGAPRAFHTRYGASPDEAIRAAGIQAIDPELTLPQALDILDAASSLRVDVSPQEFAQALYNVRETYPAGSEGAMARVFARTGGEMVEGPVRQMDDARLQRPRLPREEMLLRARLADDIANAPDNMSIDEFRQWRNRQPQQAQRQQPAPSVGRDELVELMDEGLLQPRETPRQSLELATQRATDIPQPRYRYTDRRVSPLQRQYEQLPDEMYFPRNESDYFAMDGDSLADQLRALSIRAGELSAPQERVPVQYDISGRPIMSTADIFNYLGTGNYGDTADFRARHGALLPQSNLISFDTRLEAERAQRRQQRAQDASRGRAPRRPSMFTPAAASVGETLDSVPLF